MHIIYAIVLQRKTNVV